jgi:radical SAM protein with 4Fe4S-binding SPASM domain
VLAVAEATGYGLIGPLTSSSARSGAASLVFMVLLALPYAVACWWYLASGATPSSARWRIIEWVAIVGGAGLFFALVLPLRPSLSDDVYRYVWDARLTAHGFSPYVAAPESPLFATLRDGAIYPHLYWIHVPTIYPPGAQALFLLAYWVMPSSIWAIKVEMALAVGAAALALGYYLRAQRQDPRRVLIFLWSPLIVVELGMNGHVDAAAIAIWMAALLVAYRATWPGARLAVGVLLALATLIKLYPALFLLALGQRRDRGLYIAFGATLVVGYAPFAHDGLHAVGFLPTYLTDVRDYSGLVQGLRLLLLPIGPDPRLVQGVDVLLAGLIGAGVVVGRRRGVLTDAMAALGVLLMWLVLTPQWFPWYATALIPLCASALPPFQGFTFWRGGRLRGGLGVFAVVLWGLASCFLSLSLALARAGPQWVYGATYVAAMLAGIAVLGVRVPSLRPASHSSVGARAQLVASAVGTAGPDAGHRELGSKPGRDRRGMRRWWNALQQTFMDSKKGYETMHGHDLTAAVARKNAELEPVNGSRDPSAPLPLPSELYIESTTRCNEHCDQCPRTHLGREADRDISLAEVRHIVDQFPHLDRVVLHGLGEPLLNAELPEIIAYLRSHGAFVLFNSNALLLNERRGRALISAGLNELRVSLDGGTPATYARVRGVNQKALPHIIANLNAFEGLKRSLDAVLPKTSLWFTAMRENIAELPQVIELAAQAGVREVYVQRFIYFGRGLAIEDQALFRRAWEREQAVLAEADRRSRDRGIVLTATGASTPLAYLGRLGDQARRRPWAGCRRPYTLAYITAHGNVYSCCFAPFHPGPAKERLLGNVFETPFEQIWHGERYQAFRAAFQSDTPWDQCAGCGSKWSL